jgi:hypothetical protein
MIVETYRAHTGIDGVPQNLAWIPRVWAWFTYFPILFFANDGITQRDPIVASHDALASGLSVMV